MTSDLSSLALPDSPPDLPEDVVERGFSAIRRRLLALVEVQPGKRVPYLQGCHGQYEVRQAVRELEALCSLGGLSLSGSSRGEE